MHIFRKIIIFKGFDWYLFQFYFNLAKTILGIPLTLVTVANVAKFISESIFFIHYKLWLLWMRFKNKSNNSDDDSRLEFRESEDEQVEINSIG